METYSKLIANKVGENNTAEQGFTSEVNQELFELSGNPLDENGFMTDFSFYTYKGETYILEDCTYDTHLDQYDIEFQKRVYDFIINGK